MRNCKPIQIRLQSNIPNYTIKISDIFGCASKIIYKSTQNICIYTNSPVIQLTATSRNNNINITLFYTLDTKCNSCFNLYLQFPIRAYTNNYTFRLIDKIYGLGITGSLQFAKTSR